MIYEFCSFHFTVIDVILAMISYQLFKSLEEDDHRPTRPYTAVSENPFEPILNVRKSNQNEKDMDGRRIGNHMPNNNSSDRRGDELFTISVPINSKPCTYTYDNYKLLHMAYPYQSHDSHPTFSADY